MGKKCNESFMNSALVMTVDEFMDSYPEEGFYIAWIKEFITIKNKRAMGFAYCVFQYSENEGMEYLDNTKGYSWLEPEHKKEINFTFLTYTPDINDF